jgi:hypothetical protein
MGCIISKEVESNQVTHALSFLFHWLLRVTTVPVKKFIALWKKMYVQHHI